MKFQKSHTLIVTHVLALACGLLVAWLKRSEVHTEPSTELSKRSSVSSHAQRTRSADVSGVAATRPVKSWRASEYQKAWIAVRTAQLSTSDRIQAQRSLLEAWAEVDLAAAIEAALAETWDSDTEGYYDRCGALLDVFSGAFVMNSEESWALIKSGKFGVGTGMLRNIWLSNVSFSKPLLVAGMLEELSWRDRSAAINEIRSGMHVNSKERDLIIAELAKYPKDIVSTNQLLPFLQLGKIYNKGEQLLEAAANQPPRIAEAMALQFGNRLYKSETFLTEVSQLPDHMKIAALTGAMNYASSDDSAHFTEVLDMMVNAEAWTELDQFNLPSRMKQSAERGDPALIADWVTKLPVREEFTEAIHRGVEKYVRDNMEESRTWLAQIEEPVWRDHAYAEYSQQALHAKGDAEASRWALDQIQDATFKKEAEAWRSNWEKRK
jgi:hypothetical protein